MRLETSHRFPLAAFIVAAALAHGGSNLAHAGDAPAGNAHEVVDYDDYQAVGRELQDVADQQRDLLAKKKTLRSQARQAATLAAAVDEADPALRVALELQLEDLRAEIDAVEHELALADLDFRTILAEQVHMAALLTLDACEDTPVGPKP